MSVYRHESSILECPLLNDGMAVVCPPGGVQLQQQQQTRNSTGIPRREAFYDFLK